MEPLARLQARIASLHELRDLVRALRALAASHLQEAQGALDGIRRYVAVVENAIAEGATLLPVGAAQPGREPLPEAGVMIVTCSEHGFVGTFNERLLDQAVAERAEGQKLVVIGRRGAMLAAERGIDVDGSFPMATHIGGVLATTRAVAGSLAEVSTADIVFASYRQGGNFEPETRRILPLDPALLAGAAAHARPLHHLVPEVLLLRLASEYLLAEITRAVTESLSSENGARLRVMETADHNIGDKLDGLRRTENVLRQESITSELLDLLTGSEAILHGAGH